LPIIEHEQSHRFTLDRAREIDGHSTCQRTSVKLTVSSGRDAQRLKKKLKKRLPLNN
jgi:hypothetical protein